MSEGTPPPNEDQQRQMIRVQLPDRKPIVTISILIITAMVFIAQYLLQITTGYDILFLYLGKINDFIMQGQLWRLITPALVHGGIFHFILNMYALFVIGNRLERFYKPGRFLLLYVLSAFAGNVLSFVLSSVPSLGASTAVFGVLAAEGVFIFQNRKLFGEARTRQAITNLAMILIINLGYGFLPGSKIDNMGHIGGLLGGFFFAWKAGPVLKLEGNPPFFTVVDSRQKSDILAASLVVFVGFIVIALIPFLKT
jgi:rhomboid protease GluP